MITKILAIILALYILLLSGIPCDDIFFSSPSQPAGISQTSFSASHGDTDHCSPFCTCQCCRACFQITGQPLDFIIIGCGFKYHESKSIFKSADPCEFLIPPKA